MSLLSILSFGLSILTFALMLRVVYLQSKIKMLVNFNNTGYNNGRIETAKRKIRPALAATNILCVTTGAVCIFNDSLKLAVMFLGFGLITALSLYIYRAGAVELAANNIADVNQDDEKDDSTNELEFAEEAETDASPADEQKPLSDPAAIQRKIRSEHQRERIEREADDNILDEEYLH